MRVTPDRVVISVSIDDHVEQTISARRAAKLKDLPPIEFVFVRDDGWALAACGKFAPQAFRTSRNWRTVLVLGPGGDTGEVLAPGEFVDRFEHFHRHARIVEISAEAPPTDVAPLSCGRCRWTPVPDALVDAIACDCLFCKRADYWHSIESEAARLSHDAQKVGNHELAGVEDARRVRALENAGVCISKCKRKIVTS